MRDAQRKNHRNALFLENLEKRLLLSAYDGLRISEIMYNPDPVDNNQGYTSQDFEYIEFYNGGTTTISLKNVKISEGTGYTFGNQSLAPNAYMVVARNAAALALRYDLSGVTVAPGSLDSGLSSMDERIKIEVPNSSSPDGYLTVIDMTYNPVLTDEAGNDMVDKNGDPIYDVWYPITDKGVFSLTLENPTGMSIDDHDDRDSWRPSSERYGTPGRADVLERPVVVNEVLAHSDEVNGDWIELHNLSANPVDVGNWFLSDDLAELKKYQIAEGTIIPAHGYLVFNQMEHFGYAASDPGALEPFGLSEYGDVVILSSGGQIDDDDNIELTGLFEEKDFAASISGVSFGRYEKSTDTYNFVAMSVNTPGGENAAPLAGPIVFSEIMYHPVNDQAGAEYIELFNVTDQDVTLQVYDSNAKAWIPWQFTDGIEYVFPLNTTIPAGGRLIVAQDPAVFNSVYGTPTDNPQILGPFANQTSLSNKGERLELGMPVDELTPDGIREYIRVDRANYDDRSPWPEGPDGDGTALIRVAMMGYGNDPANWIGGQVLNASPQIDSLTGQPNPVMLGEAFGLIVSSAADSDGSIAQIVFYHDSNSNGRLDSQDDQLGQDTDGSDGWQWDGIASGLYNGSNRFFAVARDNDGKDSSAISTEMIIKAPNRAPTIGSIFAIPNPVTEGSNWAITANNVSDADGAVIRCEFYLDTNQNLQIDSNDLLLGRDYNSANGWTWSGTTEGLAIGNNRILARALDNESEWSNVVSVTLTVVAANMPPVIGSLTATPDQTVKPDPIVLVADQVSDPEGGLNAVLFYLDSNTNGSYDSNDLLLGTDSDGSDGWRWTVATAGLGSGNQRFFARAQDDSGAYSPVVSVTAQINDNQPPVTGGLAVDQAVINPGDTITLSAVGVSDPENQMNAVRFYYDSNRNGRFDSGLDTLSGVDANSADGWSWIMTVTSYPEGIITFWAVAEDAQGNQSQPAGTSLRLNQAPTGGVLSIEPQTVIHGEPVTLALTEYGDPDGVVQKADFYLDSNGNGFPDESDLFLGSDNTLADGLIMTVDTGVLPAGQLSFLAQVWDDDNRAGEVVCADAGVEQFTVELEPGMAKSVRYTDLDDTEIDIKLSKGAAAFSFTGQDLSYQLIKKVLVVSGRAQLASIELLDEDCQAASMSIKAKGGDDRLVLGDINGVGLKSLNAKQADLAGTIHVTGNLGAISLGVIDDFAGIYVGSAIKGVSLTAERIGEGVQIELHDDLKKLQTASMAGGQISADSIKSVAIKSGDLAGDLVARSGDIGSVSVYGSIRGIVNAEGSIKKLATKAGSVENAVLRAGLDIGKISAQSVQDSLISSGRHMQAVQSKTDIIDSLLLCGYDIGADAIPGTGDEVLNETEQVQLKSIKTGKTGTFDGSFALAGIEPVSLGASISVTDILAGNTANQHLSEAGGVIKSVAIGQAWQGGGGDPYGLYAATAIGKISVKEVLSGVGAPGEFSVKAIWP